MLRLDKIVKPWKKSAALNDHINLYGFWSETAFLTKSGTEVFSVSTWPEADLIYAPSRIVLVVT
jgi:hypothetical protein